MAQLAVPGSLRCVLPCLAHVVQLMAVSLHHAGHTAGASPLAILGRGGGGGLPWSASSPL